MMLTASQLISQIKPTIDDCPRFQIRARIISTAGKTPDTKTKFTFSLPHKGKSSFSIGPEWSDWIDFGKEQIEATLKTYPANYANRYPVVTSLSVSGVIDPTLVEAEVKLTGNEKNLLLKAELFGSRMGLLVWKETDGGSQVDTMAGYNRRYWKHLENVTIPMNERPRLFPIVDRLIGGSDDRIEWREGIDQLNRAGFSAIMLPPDKRIRQLLLDVGQTKTAWATYSPPGYANDHVLKDPKPELEKWATSIAKPYRDAGYAAKDMAMFALSDEPGWYYPSAFEALSKNEAAMDRFRKYLAQQGLKPSDMGEKDWSNVKPAGRSKAVNLEGKKLFYWTMRFFSWDSSRHFADATKALEKEFYEGLPIYTNWNFFAGRSYVPGPVANNRDKTSEDAAMGGHDWFEFGRMRAGTMLWTEDWFGDSKAYQWSFYSSKLRCAAEKGGVQFGAYVIPRTAGDRPDGIIQKILTVIGSGGKGIKYFVFGPEYNFPGNCYSERAAILPKMAKAHRMIGAAEELLWPGKRPKSTAAILMPRSAQMWDAREQKVAKGFSDATNHNMNAATVDYLAEVFNLYLALQHENIPVDFVDEEDLSSDGLKPYRVLYVTAPNVPDEGQKAIQGWVNSGGHLVTSPGAMRFDRYDEASNIFWKTINLEESRHERLHVPNTNSLKIVDTLLGVNQSQTDGLQIPGTRTTLGGTMKAKTNSLVFKSDNSSAIAGLIHGKGNITHFAFFPGITYWKSQKGTKDGLPIGFNEECRKLITKPVMDSIKNHKESLPVQLAIDSGMIETPVLISEKGIAITLLNWRGEPVAELPMNVKCDFKPASVTSVKHGNVPFKYNDKSNPSLEFKIPLDAVDVLMIKR